ncbi:MAG: hypothetical protein ACK53H_12705, partial [Betaproteobacteria bacterium]
YHGVLAPYAKLRGAVMRLREQRDQAPALEQALGLAARLWICGRCASRIGRLAVDNAVALPTAPSFAHKLHSHPPPST